MLPIRCNSLSLLSSRPSYCCSCSQHYFFCPKMNESSTAFGLQFCNRFLERPGIEHSQWYYCATWKMLINPHILFPWKANAEWFINLLSEGGGEENVGITIIPPAQRDGQGRGGIVVCYFSPVRVPMPYTEFIINFCSRGSRRKEKKTKKKSLVSA